MTDRDGTARLAERVSVLVERIERKMAERDAEASRRELRLILTVAGLIAAAASIPWKTEPGHSPEPTPLAGR